jgi:hypothetical protein
MYISQYFDQPQYTFAGPKVHEKKWIYDDGKGRSEKCAIYKLTLAFSIT